MSGNGVKPGEDSGNRAIFRGLLYNLVSRYAPQDFILLEQRREITDAMMLRFDEVVEKLQRQRNRDARSLRP